MTPLSAGWTCVVYALGMAMFVWSFITEYREHKWSAFSFAVLGFVALTFVWLWNAGAAA